MDITATDLRRNWTQTDRFSRVIETRYRPAKFGFGWHVIDTARSGRIVARARTRGGAIRQARRMNER